MVGQLPEIKWRALLAAVLAATPALSPAATNPFIYGKINVSLDHINADGATLFAQGKSPAGEDQWELNSNASRIGIKGQVDLEGSGLQAIYQAEYEINVDDGDKGDTAFAQRNTFGGFQGGFGRLIAGKFDTPLKAAEGKVDQFNDLRGDLDNLIGGQNRVSNIVQYSVSLAGDAVQLNGAFIPGEGSDTDADGKTDSGVASSYSASIVVDKDGYYGALAYDHNQAARRSLDDIQRAEILRAVGGLRLGSLEAGVLLQRSRDAAQNSDRRDDSYLLSAAWRTGRFKLKAQYGYSRAHVSRERGTLTALGVDYALANQAVLYSYWSRAALDRADLTDNTIGVGAAYSF